MNENNDGTQQKNIDTKYIFSIGDWIKASSNISAVSEELDISRPTTYRYISLYDSGNADKLPPKCRELFDKMMTEALSDPKFNKNLSNLKDEAEIISHQLQSKYDYLTQLDAEKHKLAEEIHKIQDQSEPLSNYKRNKFDTLSERYTFILKDYLKNSQEANHLHDSLNSLLSKLGGITEYVSPYESADNPFKLKSRCYYDGTKCMVVFTERETGTFYIDPPYRRDEGLPTVLRLNLYVKIDEEYVLLGVYKPVEFRNFFIIDDVVFNAPLYYSIEAFVPNIDTDEGDEVEIIKLPPREQNERGTTGLLELRPKG